MGLSHLGICSSAAAAARGFDVVAYDGDETTVAAIARGDLPILEPELDDLMARHQDRLSFTARPEDLRKCDVVYISRDVPTNDAGESDLSAVRKLLQDAERHLRPDAILVVLCQVPPGFTRGLGHSKARLYYQVETLVFGRAIERAMYPERFILGCADPEHPVQAPLRTFLEAFGCPILAMRYESAELAKISINMCLIASVSVANTLAEICEKIGADWSEIVPSLKLDKRIGPHAYLASGLGLSGGNLERDLATISVLAERHGTDATVAAGFAHNSRHRKQWPWQVLKSKVLESVPHAAIAVWGLAYKENTHSTKNSPAIALLDHLKGRKIAIYDPAVSADAAGFPGSGASSALEASEGADVLCIMTPWPEFRTVAPSDIVARMRGRYVIDPYRVLDPVQARAAGLRCATLGDGSC